MERQVQDIAAEDIHEQVKSEDGTQSQPAGWHLNAEIPTIPDSSQELLQEIGENDRTSAIFDENGESD